MESPFIQKQIEELFADLSGFAQLAAGLPVEDYQPRRLDFLHKAIGISWLGVPIEQTNSLQEAFAALFLFDLHFQNDWIYDEAKRTNADQFVIKRLPESQWKQLLQDIWIPDYFALSYCQLCVTPVEPDEFLRRYFNWMPEGISMEEQAALKDAVGSTQWVCSLFPDAFYDLYFGQAGEYYFFAESGVYD